MDRPEPDTVLDLLAKRADLLDLLKGGTLPKSDLVDEAGVSRSTVDRAIRELEVAGLVDRTAGGFTLTLCGRLSLSEFESFMERLTNFCRSHALISVLPADTAIEPALLDGADITLPEPQVPMKPLLRFERLVEEAAEIRGFSPAVLPSYVDLFHRRVAHDDLAVELVLEEGVIERLTTTYADELGDVLETGRVGILEAPHPVPFGLLITGEGKVAVVVYEDSGIAGVITNDTHEAFEWASERYDEVRQQATPLFPMAE